MVQTFDPIMDPTTNNVETSEAALMAQRINISLKIKASIAIGKKRYWKSLASGMNFMGFTMSHCLSVIYKDIIDIWNFNDSHCYLASDQFKELILRDLDRADLLHTTNAFNISLQRIMMYIADLACIMQILCLLAPTGPISRRVIKIAIKAYEETGKSSVHSAIQSYVSVTRSGWDYALEEIVRLIENHSIKDEEVQDLRAKIRFPVDLQEDEDW